MKIHNSTYKNQIDIESIKLVNQEKNQYQINKTNKQKQAYQVKILSRMKINRTSGEVNSKYSSKYQP